MTELCPACGPSFLRWLDADPVRQSAWLALPRRWVEPGEVLQWTGQNPGAVWFVEQGLLRSHFLNASGRDRNCAFHAEWHWAGLPPSRGAPAVATFAIEALERSRVVELSHAGLAHWLQDQPELQATLADALLASAKVTLLSSGGKTDVALSSAGDRLEAKGSFKVGAGTKAVAQVNLGSGAPVSVRFTLQ